MAQVPDGFGSPPSHSSLLLPPPLLYYKTQIDRQTGKHRERQRERQRAQQRREEAGGKSNREGECRVVKCNSSNSAERKEQGKTC
jgi:regulator of protease activity HflC (stomatin/prohibitin superfamily)